MCCCTRVLILGVVCFKFLCVVGLKHRLLNFSWVSANLKSHAGWKNSARSWILSFRLDSSAEMPVGWDKISWTFAKYSEWSARGVGSRGPLKGPWWGRGVKSPKATGLLHFKNPFRMESLQEKRNINEDKVDTQVTTTINVRMHKKKKWSQFINWS